MWLQGRNLWTSQTGTDRRPVGGSWLPSAQPRSGRTQLRSEQIASRSIFPRLRLDFEKTGAKSWHVPLLQGSNNFKTSLFFLGCFSLCSFFTHLLSDLRSHPQCPSSNTIDLLDVQVSFPVRRISVCRNVRLEWVGWVSPRFAGDTQPTTPSSVVLDELSCSFSAFAKCHFKTCSFENPPATRPWS